MRELSPETVTDAVLDQMATTPDPRMKEIMASAVKHLHAFAREVNLTPGEWIKGIEFMTMVGKNKTAVEEGTHTSLLGPFYREAAPKLVAGSQIARHVKPGTECILYGCVTDINGKPLADATVSVWQTSADGLYDIQENAASVDYRGVFSTDADGVYLVRTVRPRGYSIPMDGPVGNMVNAQARHGMRPAHIHFLVGASGYRELVTALYLRDDPHLADDVVFGSSDDLAVDIVANDPNCPIKGVPSIRFDMRLPREGEADKTSGRVGSDPSAIWKEPAEEDSAKLAATARAEG